MQKMGQWIHRGDISAFIWVNRVWRNSIIDSVMSFLTNFGGAIFSICLSLLLLISGSSNWYDVGSHLAVSLLLSHLAVAVCKRAIPRLRPYRVLDQVFTGTKLLQDASFPSGHSTAAFCSAAVLSSALPELSGGFYSLATLVAISRVYLGMHYPSDVLIGALLGAGTVWLVL
jgi:undecaprenyl-diphosphatase